MSSARVAPHAWSRKGWRFWICRHCFAPRPLHPRVVWAFSRPVHRNEYLGPDAPHFKGGW